MHVGQGACGNMCPRAALQLFLEAACADSLAGPGLFQAVLPCGRQEERGRGEEVRSYTYIFVLPSHFSSCNAGSWLLCI